MNKLLPEEISDRLNQLNASTQQPWACADDCLHKNFKFGNFEKAFQFMQRVAVEAENLNHHPDWCNSYNKVTINLTTHSAGGVTELDFRLAEKIEQIVAT